MFKKKVQQGGSPLIFSKKKIIFLFNFYFEINIEPIEMMHIIPVLSTQKKMEKNSKFLGSIFRSQLFENGPEIVEKKYTVAHSTPDVTPRKK